jgi:hypothetical protein
MANLTPTPPMNNNTSTGHLLQHIEELQQENNHLRQLLHIIQLTAHTATNRTPPPPPTHHTP